MTRLSHAAATEFIEDVMDCPVDLDQGTRIEAFILDKSCDEVRTILDRFTEERGLTIDPDSIVLKADKLDLCDDDCCQITIMTEAQA